MISAEEARVLGSYKARVETILLTIEDKIRERAIGPRVQSLRITLDLQPEEDAELIDEVVAILREHKFIVSTSPVSIELNPYHEVAMTEFLVSWAKQTDENPGTD